MRCRVTFSRGTTGPRQQVTVKMKYEAKSGENKAQITVSASWGESENAIKNKNGKTDLKKKKKKFKTTFMPQTCDTAKKKYVVKSQYRRISKPNISLVCASAFYQVKLTSVNNSLISSSVNQDWRVTMQVILRWTWREELTMKLPTTPWTTFYLFITSTVFKYYVFMYASNWRTTGLLLLLSLLLYLKWKECFHLIVEDKSKPLLL